MEGATIWGNLEAIFANSNPLLNTDSYRQWVGRA